MSRNHFQTLLHRSLEAVIETLEPKKGGPAGEAGAVALSKAVPGLSRRDATTVVATVRTCLERERKHESKRVTISGPRLIRGFDAMELGRGRRRRDCRLEATGDHDLFIIEERRGDEARSNEPGLRVDQTFERPLLPGREAGHL